MLVRAPVERGNHRHLRDPDPCQVGHFPPPDLAGDREEPAQRVRKGVEEVRAGRGPGVGALGGARPRPSACSHPLVDSCWCRCRTGHGDRRAGEETGVRVAVVSRAEGAGAGSR